MALCQLRAEFVTYAARALYSGMFPCLRLGAGSRLLNVASSARTRYGRVRLGSITSST